MKKFLKFLRSIFGPVDNSTVEIVWDVNEVTAPEPAKFEKPTPNSVKPKTQSPKGITVKPKTPVKLEPKVAVSTDTPKRKSYYKPKVKPQA